MSVTLKDPVADTWEAASEHRTPGIKIKQLLQCDGAGRNLEFNVVQFEGTDFYSPAHRHNFDQIRIGLSGVTTYGERHRIKPRMIGYFPEGTFYGPLGVSEPSIQGIVQFDGASRGGYINYKYLNPATDELRALGTFSGGYYKPHDGGPKIDGYQASWERATGRKMTYPDPRFSEAVYMHIDAFMWRDTPDSTIRRKTLGIFGEAGVCIEMLLLPEGTRAAIGKTGRRVISFVLSGAVECNAVRAGLWSAIMSEESDATTAVGVAEESELILMTLPEVA